jgi:hypothetical protein
MKRIATNTVAQGFARACDPYVVEAGVCGGDALAPRLQS